MTHTYAVIGANYGDEGKGVITDALTRLLSAHVVARFNGGAQAGHTVVDGSLRHVFGTIGAGTLAGAETYLSSKFIVNPLVTAKEHDQLTDKGIAWPTVIAHPGCKVTVLSDMVINSLSEIIRDTKRHGSCGLGINETVTRHEADPRFQIDVEYAMRMSTVLLARRLEMIHRLWVPARLEKHGISNAELNMLEEEHPALIRILSQPVFEEQAVLMKAALEKCFTTNPGTFRTNVVLEGAQGLGLDEFLGEFPYVTHSITGLPYALQAAHELHRKSVRPMYVTRAYCTRHGAGPLANEGREFNAEFKANDLTNIENPWQGKIRYAPLDLRQLRDLIEADRGRGAVTAQLLNIRIDEPEIAVTCLDQVPGAVSYVDLDGEFREISTTHFARLIAHSLHLKLGATSYGPEAKHVQFE